MNHQFMFDTAQTQREILGIQKISNIKCRKCLKIDQTPKLRISCKCTKDHTHIHQECMKELVQRIYAISPSKIKKNQQKLNKQYFSIPCDYCHSNIQFSMTYTKKCISRNHHLYKFIIPELICYLVTLLISLAAIGVIIFILTKYFRQGKDSLLSVIFAFIFLIILIGVVIRMLVQLIISSRILQITDIQFNREQKSLKSMDNQEQKNQINKTNKSVNNMDENMEKS